ncbi:MAG: bifunctional DNA primase/polymerase, partial [Maritimibacter sp.]|nr:bifunctional DNA primase/polymerase [Maritimibacter sp.]
KGPQGKAPLVKFADRGRLPIELVLGEMEKANSLTYGIRLPRLVVLDLDTDDDDLLILLTDRFGIPRVHVRTPRGHHLYYVLDGGMPELHVEGLRVDVKSGPNSYVVGPGSIRPTGETYAYASNIVLGEAELTVLAVSDLQRREDQGVRETGQGKIPVGTRNKYLSTVAIQTVSNVGSEQDLLKHLLIERDRNCEATGTFPDNEVKAIVAWAWKMRLANQIFAGRASSFRVDRTALDKLVGKPGGSDAIALYVTLTDQHGHRPGKTFALIHERMRDAGWTELSRRRFLAARRMLEAEGLLKLANPAIRAERAAQFQLMSPVPAGVQRLQK